MVEMSYSQTKPDSTIYKLGKASKVDLIVTQSSEYFATDFSFVYPGISNSLKCVHLLRLKIENHFNRFIKKGV